MMAVQETYWIPRLRSLAKLVLETGTFITWLQKLIDGPKRPPVIYSDYGGAFDNGLFGGAVSLIASSK